MQEKTEQCVWLGQEREAPDAPTKKRRGENLSFKAVLAEAVSEVPGFEARKKSKHAAQSANEVSIPILGMVDLHVPQNPHALMVPWRDIGLKMHQGAQNREQVSGMM